MMVRRLAVVGSVGLLVLVAVFIRLEPVAIVDAVRPPLPHSTDEEASNQETPSPAIPRRGLQEQIDEVGAGDPLPEHQRSPNEAEVMAQAEHCLASMPSEGVAAVVACLASIPLDLVSCRALANWACETEMELQSVSLLASARISRLPAVEVVAFVEGFQDGCQRFRETGLTLSALTSGRNISEEWYREVAATIDEAHLIAPSGSESTIQLSESFIESGDSRIEALIQDLGRGLLGGTERQVHRAALIATVHSKSPEGRVDYLQSVLTSSTTAPRLLGGLIGHMTTDGSCIVNGDGSRAAWLLRAALSDPHMGPGVAAQIYDKSESPPPGFVASEWSAILNHARMLVN